MSESSSAPQAPRIAIKFSGSATSTPRTSNGTKKLGHSQPPSSLGKRSRSHALNQESDSEEDEFSGSHKAVTTLGGDVTEKNSKKRASKTGTPESTPFVIPNQPNYDWRSEAKRLRTSRNTILSNEIEGQFNTELKETEPADQDKAIKWGLTITKKIIVEESDEKVARELCDAGSDSREAQKTLSESAIEEQRDADQEATDALLGKEKKKKLVIASSSNSAETDALHRAYGHVGKESTLEDHDQIPDGEFGLAMLRGMGFDGKRPELKAKEVKRRPNLIGLGAKLDEEVKKAEDALKYGHYGGRRPRLDEYRAGKEKERQRLEEKRPSGYRNERERERAGQGDGRRLEYRDKRDHRDRHRDPGQDSHRHRNRDSRR